MRLPQHHSTTAPPLYVRAQGSSCRHCWWPEPRAHSSRCWPGPRSRSCRRWPGFRRSGRPLRLPQHRTLPQLLAKPQAPQRLLVARSQAPHTAAGTGQDSGTAAGRCGCHSPAPALPPLLTRPHSCRYCRCWPGLPGPRWPHSCHWWPGPQLLALARIQVPWLAAATATAPHRPAGAAAGQAPRPAAAAAPPPHGAGLGPSRCRLTAGAG